VLLVSYDVSRYIAEGVGSNSGERKQQFVTAGERWDGSVVTAFSQQTPTRRGDRSDEMSSVLMLMLVAVLAWG